MDQMTLGLDPLPKKTRKAIFLEEMNQVVPWAALVALIQPLARGAHPALGGRPPFPTETLLRIHCLPLWWNLGDPAMEEELHERPLTAASSAWTAHPACPTRRPSCGSGTCRRSTSPRRRCWPPSTRDWPGTA